MTAQSPPASRGLWRLSAANAGYKLCATYPEALLVPSGMTDGEVAAASRFRSKRRLPAITWFCGSVSLSRASQPMAGMFNARSGEDERLVSSLASSGGDPVVLAAAAASAASSLPLLTRHRADDGSPAALAVFDARPRLNALGNRTHGGGSEAIAYYPRCSLTFLGIDNIHVVRDAMKALRARLQSDRSKSLHRAMEATAASATYTDIGALAAAAHRSVAGQHHRGQHHHQQHQQQYSQQGQYYQQQQQPSPRGVGAGSVNAAHLPSQPQPPPPFTLQQQGQQQEQFERGQAPPTQSSRATSTPGGGDTAGLVSRRLSEVEGVVEVLDDTSSSGAASDDDEEDDDDDGDADIGAAAETGGAAASVEVAVSVVPPAVLGASTSAPISTSASSVIRPGSAARWAAAAAAASAPTTTGTSAAATTAAAAGPASSPRLSGDAGGVASLVRAAALRLEAAKSSAAAAGAGSSGNSGGSASVAALRSRRSNSSASATSISMVPSSSADTSVSTLPGGATVTSLLRSGDAATATDPSHRPAQPPLLPSQLLLMPHSDGVEAAVHHTAGVLAVEEVGDAADDDDVVEEEDVGEMGSGAYNAHALEDGTDVEAVATPVPLAGDAAGPHQSQTSASPIPMSSAPALAAPPPAPAPPMPLEHASSHPPQSPSTQRPVGPAVSAASASSASSGVTAAASGGGGGGGGVGRGLRTMMRRSLGIGGAAVTTTTSSRDSSTEPPQQAQQQTHLASAAASTSPTLQLIASPIGAGEVGRGGAVADSTPGHTRSPSSSAIAASSSSSSSSSGGGNSSSKPSFSDWAGQVLLGRRAAHHATHAQGGGSSAGQSPKKQQFGDRHPHPHHQQQQQSLQGHLSAGSIAGGAPSSPGYNGGAAGRPSEGSSQQQLELLQLSGDPAAAGGTHTRPHHPSSKQMGVAGGAVAGPPLLWLRLVSILLRGGVACARNLGSGVSVFVHCRWE